MCCVLGASYIPNSDPSILEQLKGCPDLTNAQAAAVQTLLINGKTKYGYINSIATVADFHCLQKFHCLQIYVFTFALSVL